MKVLVTGGAGFIGSHTADKLFARGAEVIIVDDLSTGKRENINKAAEFVCLDIASPELSGVFNVYRPEVVIHLAAQVSVAKSLVDPVRDSMTNINGTVNLLENCRRCEVKKVVYASSAAVYGNPDSDTVSELTPTRPMSFYGISKLTPEYYLSVFNHLYGLDFTVLRYANVYGPRQDAQGEGGVVSIFASKVQAGERPLIHGDGEQTRDFIYVEDIAEANIRAMGPGNQKAFNIGTGCRTSVNMLFDLIARLSGSALKAVYAEPREGDIRHSCMDVTRALDALDWKAQYSLEEGLFRTLEFYKGAAAGC